MVDSKKIIAVALSVVMMSGVTTSAFASNATAEKQAQIISIDLQQNGNNSAEVIELSQEEIDTIKEALNQETSSGVFTSKPFNENVMVTSSTAAQGTYVTTITIIGVGAVAIYTGGIMIAGMVFDFASSVYDAVKGYVEPYIIGASIPKSLRKDGDTVDLGVFKDKHGNTPENKNSGTFTNGNWTIDKDEAGHATKKWKLKKNGSRVASLGKDGKIISK